MSAAPFIEGPPGGVQRPPVDNSSTCTTNELLGFRVLRPLGVVRGITVRSRNIGVSIGAAFKSMAGGEISSMTTLCESAREEACKRMLEHAAERGADGVVCIRYDSNSIAPNITEIVAYGMAVTDGGVPSGAAGSIEGMTEGWICTSNELPGHSVHQSLGVVQGLTVRTRNAVAQLGADFKALAGGEIKTLTKMCEDARQQAYARMVAAAVERGADGIVAMRYDTNELLDGVTEVLAFGTAVTSAAREVGRMPGGTGGIPQSMITTSSSLPALGVQHSLGVVQGISVQSSSLPKAIGASFKAIVGGEIKTWTKLCSESREKAFESMVQQAHQRGGKGIVAMRYDCNQLGNGIVEVIAYGTAVTDEPLPARSSAPAASAAEVPWSSVSTDLEIPGHRTQQALGTVRGISVRSTNLFLAIGAGLKTIVGGEIRNFTRMCEEAREEAFTRMMQHASELGATGVTAMRYESNDPEPGVIEVVAYGTAVSDASRPSPPPTNAPGGTMDVASTSTTNELHGRRIQRSLGVARGITVRSRNVLANIGAGLKAKYLGGEISTWTSLCESTRQEALERLLQHAAQIGGQGVVGLRYETNKISPVMMEVIAYGTVVA